MALESAITLLEKQAELQPTCKLHQMLGDLLARVHEEEKALEHYSIALKWVYLCIAAICIVISVTNIVYIVHYLVLFFNAVFQNLDC